MTSERPSARATLLAFDTATERISVAVQTTRGVLARDAAGGAQASATLLPTIVALLREAGVALAGLDAIAFGRGPGAFTGLRTACSVAQGLALGAAKPVLPIDTLLAVAECARGDAGAPLRVWAAMDARMDEIYAAQYRFDAGRWQVLDAPQLLSPEALDARWRRDPPEAVAGSALRAFGERLGIGAARPFPDAWPAARGLLPLAQQAWDAGAAVDAAQALPLYLRDKVAQTTAERDALRAAPVR